MKIKALLLTLVVLSTLFLMGCHHETPEEVSLENVIIDESTIETVDVAANLDDDWISESDEVEIGELI